MSLSDSEVQVIAPIFQPPGNGEVLCDACKNTNVFGVRGRETLDECSCVFDSDLIRDEFFKFVHIDKKSLSSSSVPKLDSKQILEMLMSGNIQDAPEESEKTETNLTYAQILNLLLATPRTKAIGIFHPPLLVARIGNYVKNAIHRLGVTFSPLPHSGFQYVDVGTRHGVIAREIGKKLRVRINCLDIDDNRLTAPQSDNEYEKFFTFNGVDLNAGKNIRLVTCFDYLSRCPDPEGLVNSIHDHMKKGGVLVIREFDCLSWERAYALDYMNQCASSMLGEDMSIVSYRSRKGWIEMITSAGFRHVSEETWGPFTCYRYFFDVFVK